MYKIIEKRSSIRNFEKKSLSKSDQIKVKDILKSSENIVGPFNHKASLFFIDNINRKEGKIGTYGFVRNSPAFVGGIVENTRQGMVDFGFIFEEVILRLTKEGLGTVWLGGTFSRKDFNIELKNDEIIAAISPVGYPTNRSIREKVIRSFAKADKRIAFEELFFLGKELKSIDEKHQYYKYLKAVQIGPSASNKQPWRIVVIDDTFHMYLNPTKGYGDKLKMDIQAIDIGIALSHLYLTLKEDHHSAGFIKEKPFDLNNCEYIISIEINNTLSK